VGELREGEYGGKFEEEDPSRRGRGSVLFRERRRQADS